MGGTGGLPAEQHPAQQGRHSGGFLKMEVALTSTDAEEFRVVLEVNGWDLEMRLNAVLDVN